MTKFTGSVVSDRWTFSGLLRSLYGRGEELDPLFPFLFAL